MHFEFHLNSFFRDHKLDIYCLVFILAFLSILSYFLLKIDMEMGVYYVRDVFSYLNNALRFADIPAGLDNMKGLSPLIPFLSSLIFRMGFVYDWVIMVVSILFYILSGIGMYLFLRLRFKELFSCCGAIILVTFSINLAWASKGMLDIPGMALSIWALYFMVLAIDNDSKFFYLAFPTFILGFFTRYTVVLMLPIMLISILFLKKPFDFLKKEFKNLFGGMIVGFITTIPFLLYYYLYNIPMFFLSQTKAISAETSGIISTSSEMVKTSVFYYLNNLPIYISTKNFPPYSLKPGKFLFDDLTWIGGNPSFIGYLFLIVLVIGLIIYLYDLFKKDNRILIFNKEDIINKKIYIKIALCFLFLSSFIVTFNKISVVYSLILFSIAFLMLYRIFYKSKIKEIKLDFLVLYWFLVNLIFFSSHLMKVGRYFISLTPPLAYFIILGIFLIMKKFKSTNSLNSLNSIASSKSSNNSKWQKFKIFNKDNFNKSQSFISIVLIAILTIFTISCFFNQPITYDNQKPDDILYASQNEKDIANWIIQHDSNYESKTIWADRGGDFSFFLKKNISSVDKLSNNENFTKELLKSNVSYFLSNGENKIIDSNQYRLIKREGNVFLYGKIF